MNWSKIMALWWNWMITSRVTFRAPGTNTWKLHDNNNLLTSAEAWLLYAVYVCSMILWYGRAIIRFKIPQLPDWRPYPIRLGFTDCQGTTTEKWVISSSVPPKVWSRGNCFVDTVCDISIAGISASTPGGFSYVRKVIAETIWTKISDKSHVPQTQNLRILRFRMKISDKISSFENAISQNSEISKSNEKFSLN